MAITTLSSLLALGAAAPYPPLAPRIFEPLPLGAIAPAGWVLEQLVRQASSLSGYLSGTQNLGGYHGDSNVVNMTKWLGGHGGGPGYIASNDQWYPYWANGNVPLLSLLRAAGALGRLPHDLPLDAIINAGMAHVLATADDRAGYAYTRGAITAGGDVDQRNLTVAEAEEHCAALATCAGFTYAGAPNATGLVHAYFKASAARINADPTWSTYARRRGWASGHLLSEGGTQIVQALCQWAEDRPADDQRRVARIVLRHLLAVADGISPESVVSWAATRWPSVNTLFDCARRRDPHPPLPAAVLCVPAASAVN